MSHYGLRVDTSSPEQFGVTISPAARTSVKTPLIIFSTNDKYSGVDHYEIKIVPLKIEGRTIASIGEQLFVNAESPYQTEELLNGSYDVVVRAYDKVGNIQEVTRRLEISDSWFWFLSQDGVVVPFGYRMSWILTLSLLLLLILLLILLAYFARKWYKLAHQQVADNHLPAPIATQLEELQRYRARYGKMVVLLLCMISFGALWLNPMLSLAQLPEPVAIPIPAQPEPASVATPAAIPVTGDDAQLTPPVITSYSANIKDDEIFYVSGRTTEPEQEVVVHLQSMVDGGAFDFNTVSDKRGDWTYRHDDFLAGGKYIVWAHAKDGVKLSIPSPQVEMDVKPVALNWGNSRITYQSLYIGMISALLLIIFGLIIFIIVHAVLVRHRRRVFAHSLRQAEDSIKRGFIALRRDIEAELVLVKQAHLPADLAGEQKVREQQLEEDLKNIEALVGKEMWEVETFEKLPESS